MPKRYANTAHFIEATALHRGTSRSVRTILGIRCQASSSQNRTSLMGAEVGCHAMRAKVRAEPEAETLEVGSAAIADIRRFRVCDQTAE
jgi:hypothetical protein